MRRTIAATVSVTGVGLHSGKSGTVTLNPSQQSGWVLNDHPVQSLPIVSGRLATVLRIGNTTVSTVEHLFAALYAHQIDDVRIDIEGGEIPILDGSAQQWFQAIHPQMTERPVHVLSPNQPILLQANDASLQLYPADEFSARMHVDFEGYAPQTFDGTL